METFHWWRSAILSPRANFFYHFVSIHYFALSHPRQTTTPKMPNIVTNQNELLVKALKKDLTNLCESSEKIHYAV